MVTTDVMVFTKSPKRWFDQDAERVPHVIDPAKRRTWQVQDTGSRGDDGDRFRNLGDPAGAPLLDWWELPETDTDTWQPEGEPSMARYLIGDVLEVAKTLEPGSVDLIVSSPPFLAVRSYLPADHPDKAKEGGQQSTPGGYIDWLISVVEALAPSLAPHGSLVFELGDTYAGANGMHLGPRWHTEPRYGEKSDRVSRLAPSQRVAAGEPAPDWPIPADERDEWEPGPDPIGGNGWPRAKSKSLIPELFRLALTYGLNPLTGRTTDRWILRNVITWCQPNPTPGALGDKVRPATSDIAVFTKSGKRWFDLDAERTAANDTRPRNTNGPKSDDADPAAVLGHYDTRTTNPAGAPLLDWWELPPGGYSGAHYAVWPPELVRRLISLMCPLRVCRVCGEPSRRVVSEPVYVQSDGRVIEPTSYERGRDDKGILRQNVTGRAHGNYRAQRNTLGWSDCGHGPDNWREGVVLDPFAGSGTTLAVASGMGRESIGIDLDDRNLELARERVGMFLEEG